jgi:hypothetical protein
MVDDPPGIRYEARSIGARGIAIVRHGGIWE